MKARAWPAPAKLNLFLHITGRRADGYHLLQTVFQFIDRCDRLYFDVRNDGVIRRLSDLPGVNPEQDLTVRAARLLREEAGQEALGADIHIEKHLPMGGGLGGGSSDAATTLVALNTLWGLRLPLQRLAELGLRLGADVPVFVQGRAAWAEGVGEKLIPVILPEPWYAVLVPACHVPTAGIFSAQELTRDLPPITIEGFLSGQGWNVCEPVVRSRYPQVAEALDWLAQFGQARMTGTGACVFCVFDDELEARRVLTQRPPSWQGFVARGMNESPLFEMRGE